MAAQRFRDRFGADEGPEQEKLAREVQDAKDEAEKVSPSRVPAFKMCGCKLTPEQDDAQQVLAQEA